MSFWHGGHKVKGGVGVAVVAAVVTPAPLLPF
jgi:hypothetical protein